MLPDHPFFISDPTTLFHLVSFTTPGAAFAALIKDLSGHKHFLVRDLESTNWVSTDETITVHTYAETNPIKVLASLLQGCRTIAYDAESPRMTVGEYRDLYEAVPDCTEWIDISEALKQRRLIKTPREVEFIRNAARYVRQGYESALACVSPDVSENRIAAEMAHGTKCAGSEYTAYPEFVSSGKNGLRGHFAASRDPLTTNTVLFMELGAAHNRYHAAKMHTVYVGKTPPGWYFTAERSIRRALHVARTMCKDGMVCSDVDRAMRDVVNSPDMQRRSGYTIGIGCCVDWSDGTVRLNPTSSDVLRTGMVLHVIPWVQIEGIGAVGFSDVIHVGEHGATSLFHEPLQSQYPGCVFHMRHSPLKQHAPAIAVQTSHTPDTPLVRHGALYFKDERKRHGARSFKIRGVESAVDSLFRAKRLKRWDTVISQSDGNHGEALALVASRRDLKCHIILPHNVSPERVRRHTSSWR